MRAEFAKTDGPICWLRRAMPCPLKAGRARPPPEREPTLPDSRSRLRNADRNENLIWYKRWYMIRTITLVLTSVVFVGCSLHFSGRVQKANTFMVAFLFDYLEAQLYEYNRTGHFSSKLQPESPGDDWRPLGGKYSRVLDFDYRCSFDLSPQAFSVACSPRKGSDLKSSFRVDQSCSIKLSSDVTLIPRPLAPTEPEQIRLRKAQATRQICPPASASQR